MKFFDYLYYKVCKAYSTTQDSSPEGAALAVNSAIQSFSVFIFFMVLAIIKKNKAIFNLTIAMVTIVFFIVFNYIRYIYKENNNYEIMKKKWLNESNSNTKGLLIVLYIFLTTSIFFGLAVYLGTKKW
ncbi:MAG: hypothetical protein KGM16_20050 [Bacteroidota bacterium]|nr:hypothetical protein [Bacteroidota bacterium]